MSRMAITCRTASAIKMSVYTIVLVKRTEWIANWNSVLISCMHNTHACRVKGGVHPKIQIQSLSTVFTLMHLKSKTSFFCSFKPKQHYSVLLSKWSGQGRVFNIKKPAENKSIKWLHAFDWLNWFFLHPYLSQHPHFLLLPSSKH